MNAVNEMIEKIKLSQSLAQKLFEEHQSITNDVLSLLNSLKKETPKEVVKVQDPLDELKKVKVQFDIELEKLSNENLFKYNVSDSYYHFLTQITKLVELYSDKKISATFKDLYLQIFNVCIKNVFYRHEYFRDMKTFVLKVRDIKWLLQEMNKYPFIFQFDEQDIETLQKHGASRDNIYFVKKLLKQDGEFETYFEDNLDQIRFKYNMKDGKLDGLFEEFYPNGNLKWKTIYKNGKIHGELKQFFKDKSLMTQTNYKEQEIDGEYVTFFQDGKKRIEGNYIMGKLACEYKEWHANGKLSLHSYYKVGKKDGEHKSWNENGVLQVHSHYLDGNLDGEYKDYYPNGELFHHSNWKDGFLEGEYKKYHQNGRLGCLCYYKNNLKHGEYKLFYESGRKYIVTNYVEDQEEGEKKVYYDLDSENPIHYTIYYKGDKKHGEYLEFYRDGTGLHGSGNKKCSYNYKDGVLDGEDKEWYINGQISQECYYKDGKKHGKYKKFDKNGMITLKCQYKDDIKLEEPLIRLRKVNQELFEVELDKIDTESYFGELIAILEDSDEEDFGDKFRAMYLKAFSYVCRKYYGKKRNDLKVKILAVRGVGWFVKELLKYTIFEFEESDLEYFKEDLRTYYMVKEHLKLDGEYITYHDGQDLISSRYYRKDGKKDGVETSYYEDGKVRTVIPYKMGNMDGEYKWYNKEGGLFYHIFFKDDKIDGEYLMYDDDGTLQEKDYYVMGKLHGTQTSYYPNGGLKRRIEYNVGEKVGEEIEWDEKGEIIKNKK